MLMREQLQLVYIQQKQTAIILLIQIIFPQSKTPIVRPAHEEESRRKEMQDNHNNQLLSSSVSLEIVAAFTPTLYWTYKAYTPEELAQIDAFLTNFNKQLRAILLEPTFDANFRVLADKIGLNYHPSMAPRTKSAEYAHLAEEGYGERYAIFLNHKVDCATLKLLAFLSPIATINSLKFSNNSFNEQQIKLLSALISKEENAHTLFFQWNPQPDAINNTLIPCLLRPSLMNIILRSNKIGDQPIKQLLTRITPDSKLKYIDLYDNNLSPAIVPALAKLIEENKSLQHIGLSKNNIKDPASLNALFNSIGRIKLSESEYVEYKKLEKERDEIVEKNKKKKKGAPDEPVPFLLKIQQINGEWYYIKNTKLRGLGLGWSGLANDTFSVVKAFIERVTAGGNDGAGEGGNQNFELILVGNSFKGHELETLRETEGIKI